MTLTELPVADRHRAVAAEFARLTEGVATPTQWSAPTPVPEWQARDIVGHLIDWLPGLLASGSDVRLPSGPDVATDPAGAWQLRSAAIQTILDDTRIAGAPFRSTMFGDLTVEQLIDRFYIPDVFMHAWDLARATGQPHELDRALASSMLMGMRGMEDTIRASGQFGTQQPVDADASAGDQLMAFAGRDPNWRP